MENQIIRNTYSVQFTAKCPNNNTVDNYTLSVDTNNFIEAEELIKYVQFFKDTAIFQEQLIVEIANKVNLSAIYTLKGVHQGVSITSIYYKK